MTTDLVTSRRPLARTTVELPTLGLGTANLGNLYRAMDGLTAYGIVETAWDLGVRYFDTAPHYGLGLSERRLGAALTGRDRDSYVLSTKVGRLLRPNPTPRAPTSPTSSTSATTSLGSSTTPPTASAAAWRRVWSASGSTASTSSVSTIPTTTSTRPSPARPRPWRPCGTRGSSARSASG